jgi:hypothetical protein
MRLLALFAVAAIFVLGLASWLVRRAERAVLG